MPRHDGGTRDRTRKHRKRRARNGQSWADLNNRRVARCRFCRITLDNSARLAGHIAAVHPGFKEQDE